MHELDEIFEQQIDGRKEMKICEKEGESYYLIKYDDITEFIIKYDDEQETEITTTDRNEIKKNWDIVMSDEGCIDSHKLRAINTIRKINGLEPLSN